MKKLFILFIVFNLLQEGISQTNTFPVSGNVGIGTTSPQAKLHINNGDNSYGTILANANESPFCLYAKTLTTQPTNTESFRFGLKYGTDENNGFISFYRGGSTNGGWLTFSTFGSERMRIDNTGNISIGTTDSKGYRLAVNGSAIFTKAVIKQNGNWPDYVFTNDYNLQPLSQVEQFIKTNKHLPEIPSAKGVEKNGLDIGDNQTLLLKKIEELTLYLIEQNKKTEEQNKKAEQLIIDNGQLKKENEQLKSQVQKQNEELKSRIEKLEQR